MILVCIRNRWQYLQFVSKYFHRISPTIFFWLSTVSGGRQGRAPHFGPNSFIFMQFLAKILQNNRFEHPREVGAPWEILDSPLIVFSLFGF